MIVSLGVPDPKQDSEETRRQSAQKWFVLMSGNDNFTQWFYTEIMRGRSRNL